jgi:hypothetical protein
MSEDYKEHINRHLNEVGIAVKGIEERPFPGERWLVVYVPADSLVAAQSIAGEIENGLNASSQANETPFSLVFRPYSEEAPAIAETERRGRLAGAKFDQLIQLLEARSRTSDALPSLKYVEDPRASLAAVAASRHQFIYGRRGVGKTAILLEAKRLAERKGDVTIWLNAHTFRGIDAPTAYLRISDAIFNSLLKHGGTSQAEAFIKLREESDRIHSFLEAGRTVTKSEISRMLPGQNAALRSVLRRDLMRLNIYIDDFYFFPTKDQPYLLDYSFGLLRDCDGWLKIASIERLTRTFEPSSRAGLEIPHDASKIDLDRTLEDPSAAQEFLEQMLLNYTVAAGVGELSSIAKRQALGRLVLASGGVPRDYLNLFASSIVQARRSRPNAKEVGREDVAVAAGGAARGKKRDLEQDVAADTADALLYALDRISAKVKGEGFSYFRINLAEKSDEGYGLLGQLTDLRFIHLIQATLSDQHKGGVKYEAYVLDLSEYSDVRVKRGLEVLELEEGQWFSRLAGKVGTEKRLTGSQLRDRLRLAPLVSVKDLLNVNDDHEKEDPENIGA